MSKQYALNITKSRSGHHTLTLRSVEFPHLVVRLRKLGTIDQTRDAIPRAQAELDLQLAGRRDAVGHAAICVAAARALA